MGGDLSLLAFWFNYTGARPTARIDFREEEQNPDVTEIRNRGARERVSVMRAASPLSAPGST
jgi:hypothetical protein